ncbi:hypothetical protein ScPMuIL_006669 [Solemya velum]
MRTKDMSESIAFDVFRNPEVVGKALREVILRSKGEGRVTCGLYPSVVALERKPDRVMFCVLPEADQSVDVTVHLQQTLISAYCWENGIRVIKVDSDTKLRKLLSSARDLHNNTEQTFTCCHGDDVSCLVVEFPQEMKTEELFVCEHHDHVILYDIYPRPIAEFIVDAVGRNGTEQSVIGPSRVLSGNRSVRQDRVKSSQICGPKQGLEHGLETGFLSVNHVKNSSPRSLGHGPLMANGSWSEFCVY